jgi:hypothetical protein
VIPLVRVCCVGAVAVVATTVMAQPTSLLVGPFSHLAVGGMPVGWEQMRFSSITVETEYGLVLQNGRVVLEARSQVSASAALKRVSIDVVRRPVIQWSWKTSPDCYAGDWGDPETDDFPLRLFVIFEPTGGVFSRLKRLGPGFQGDSIVYVPRSVPARTSDPTSHVNARIKVLPVEPVTAGGAGATDDDGWVHHRRDVRADYVALFGREADTVAGVAVMTDTDNSGTACVSHFGDISFSESAL